MLKFLPDFNSYTTLLAIDNGRIASEGNGREDQQRKSVLLLFAIFNGITRAHIEAGAIYFPLCIKSPSGGHRTFCVERIVRSRRSFLVADAAAARLMKCV